MRDLVRRVLVNSLSLFVVSIVFSGLIVKGGLISYIWAGALLAALTTLFDPVIKVVTLPFNILTLGLLSFLSTMVALFVLTLFYHNVAVVGFVFHGFSFLGVHVAGIQISGFLSYVAISATIYFTNKIIDMIFTK